MHSPGSRVLFVCALTCGALVFAGNASAATPSFTIAASNVTMPSDGSIGTSLITLSSVAGFSGKVTVDTQFSGTEMNAKPPNCGIRTSPLYTLNAKQSVHATVTCYPYGKVVPVASPAAKPGPMLVLGAAGVLLIRRRLRGNISRWLGLFIVSAITVAFAGACGGNGLSGTYPFTVTATDSVTQASVSTPMIVTVP